MPPPNNPAGVKACYQCKETKPLDKFSKSKHGKYVGGVRTQCKACQSAEGKIYRALKKESDPDYSRRQHFRLRFKMSLKELHEIFVAVSFRCEACGIHQNDTHNNALSLDHDHACCPGEYTCGECVRGVLCTKCNVAYGALGDSVENVEKLYEYARSR